MEGNEGGSALGALVAKCACSNKKVEQVSYLAKVIMKAMKDRYRKGEKIPDSLGIPAIEAFADKDAYTAYGILDGIYSFVSESLLDGSILNIRADVISIMQEELKRRQQIKQEANI